MDLFDAEVNPYDISTLQKQLDKAELKYFLCDIDQQCLINHLKCHNIKIETKTTHKNNYMGLGPREHTHKAKLKETKDDDLCYGTHEVFIYKVQW